MGGPRSIPAPRSGPAAALAALLAAALLLALPSGAAAKRNLDIGFADGLFSGAESDKWLGEAEGVGANAVRVNLQWALVAPSEPTLPRNPGDPAYRWGEIDTAVNGATARGMDVLLTVYGAPNWARGENPPKDIRPAAWKPKVGPFGDFAHAVAQRYPKVKFFQAWNEPNLSTYLAPQWKGKKQLAAGKYRKLLNEFYDEVKAANRRAKVVAAGTSPFGDGPGGDRTRPLRFWRELLCLKGSTRKLRRAKGCTAKTKMNAAAHHPINVTEPPRKPAAHRDDVRIADFGEFRKTIRAAEKLGTVRPEKGKRALIASELWWETDPPERKAGIPLRKHAAWTTEGLYRLWKAGASAVYFLQVRDAAYKRNEPPLQSYQTGVFTHEGKKKPTYKAVQFPFLADRKTKRKIAIWGKAPRGGKLKVVQKRGKNWKPVKGINVKRGKVFTTTLKGKRFARTVKLRAQVKGVKSLSWKQK